MYTRKLCYNVETYVKAISEIERREFQWESISSDNENILSIQGKRTETTYLDTFSLSRTMYFVWSVKLFF